MSITLGCEFGAAIMMTVLTKGQNWEKWPGPYRWCS